MATMAGKFLHTSGKLQSLCYRFEMDNRALTLLRHGGKVLITAADKVRYGNDVKQTYLPVFWNTS